LLLARSLVQAGIVLLCLGCAIFGITEVPTDGVDFDTVDYGTDHGESSVATPLAAATGTSYAPPTGNDETYTDHSELDPEKGVGAMLTAPQLQSETQNASQIQDQAAVPLQAAPVDLLDDVEQGKQIQQSNSGELHDLD
jgi:hypothetical protein